MTSGVSVPVLCSVDEQREAPRVCLVVESPTGPTQDRHQARFPFYDIDDPHDFNHLEVRSPSAKNSPG